MLRDDFPWVLQVRSEQRQEESEQRAAERIMRAMPAEEFDVNGLVENIVKLQAADYFLQPALSNRYARIIAGMLASDASMRLLAENDGEYAAIMQDVRTVLPSDTTKLICDYMPCKDWHEELTLQKQGDSVTSAAFSPDGSKVATASGDGMARIWDASTGELLHVLRHTNSVKSAVFSPDGRRILTASYNDMARIWDANTGVQIALPGHRQRDVSAARLRLRGMPKLHDCDMSAAFSSDGARIVTASSDHTATILNANTGARLLVLHGHTKEVLKAAFSPDGSKIVTGSLDGTARIWDANTGEPLHVLSRHAGLVTSVGFSSDNSKLVTASYAEAIARIWNANTGELLHILSGHTGGVYSAAFSLDGRKVVTTSDDGTVRIWDANTGDQLDVLVRPTDWYYSAAFSPDGRRIVATSLDGAITIYVALLSLLSLPLNASSSLSTLDTAFFRLLFDWAGKNNVKISKTGWYGNVLRDIQWRDVQPPASKREIQKLVRETAQPSVAGSAASAGNVESQ